MTTKIFHDFSDVCAEEVCGTDETGNTGGEDFLENGCFYYPSTRSRTSSQESTEESSGRPSTRSRADSGALLEMLAEVASQKLLFSPVKRKGDDGKRSASDQDGLTLSQVKSLSTNQLIKLFSTTEFNEMKKLYSFHCAFDGSCDAKFSSFGNENKAKDKFKQHLLQHLENLKTTDSQLVPKLMGKKKTVYTKRMKKTREVQIPSPLRTEIKQEPVEFTDDILLETTTTSSKELSWNEQFVINSMPKQTGFLFEEKGPKVEVELVGESTNRVEISTAETSAALDLNKLIAGLSEKMGMTGVVEEHSYFTAEKPGENLKTEPVDQEALEYAEVKVFHPSEELKQFMDGEAKDTVMVCVVEGNNLVLKHLPPVAQQIDIESTMDSTFDDKNYSIIRSNDLPIIANNRTKSPPPSTAYLDPSALWELNRGLNIERDEFQQAKKPKGKAKFIGQSKAEKERALELIDAMKKKTGGVDSLQCNICQPPRVFTAPTTLISHYRSHAGIKPYECRICNSSFTRQHSLNYHMLIHSNQTRFTCQDCGRKFRHPSHFKEHRRRHTGESPFECSDCLMRFKTRNTYKRHLRTRHGKVLTTSGGLIILSEDEFQMVRTMPRQNITQVKRGRPRKDLMYGVDDRDQENYDSNIDAIDEDIQALHQLEIVTSHEGNYDSYGKDNSMDIDEMPVDFITDEDEAASSTNAAYEEIVKEAVRLEQAEKEKRKLQSKPKKEVTIIKPNSLPNQKIKVIVQNGVAKMQENDDNTIVIETEDPLNSSGLYLATLEDGQTVLVNTDEVNDDDEDERKDDQKLNVGFKLFELGVNRTLTERVSEDHRTFPQLITEEEYNIVSSSNDNEPTVIVLKNEPLCMDET